MRRTSNCRGEEKGAHKMLLIRRIPVMDRIEIFIRERQTNA
jgi:hypothetical protein